MRFPESEPLSPDLEWMLKSGQVSRAVLAEALVSQYYAPVHRLALSILGDEDAAAWAARETFRTATARPDRYRGEGEVGLWLDRLALEACQKLSWRVRLTMLIKNRLPRVGAAYTITGAIPRDERDVVLWRAVDRLAAGERLPALLYYAGDRTVPEIVRLIGSTENEVGRRLGMARDRFADALTYTTQAIRLNRDELEAEVRAALEQRWPLVQPTVETLEEAGALAAAEEKTAVQGTRKAGRSGTLRETLWMWVIAVLAIAVLWGGNQLLASPEPARPPAARLAPAKTATPQPTEQLPTQTPAPRPSATPGVTPVLVDFIAGPGDTLQSVAAQFGTSPEALQALNHLPPGQELEPGRMIQAPFPLPEIETTPTPLSKAANRLPPLDAGALPREISTRLLASDHLWRTLWVDGRVIDHGAAGYAGPPISSRLQIWVSQPGQSLELFGPVAGGPRDRVVTGDGWRINPYLLGADNQTRSRGFILESSALLEYSYGRELIFPSLSNWIQAEGRFQVDGVEAAAGRPTLRADWYDRQGIRRRRLWIDAQTGVVLREQLFDRRDGQTLTWEVQFLEVVFDQDFPAGIFDLLTAGSRGFANDYNGVEEVAHLPVPTPGWSQAPGHESLAYTLKQPPPGFDPSRNRLTFQYQLNTSGTPNPAGGGLGVDLFADRYYLGSLNLQNPRNARCARSDDGLWVALYTDRHWMEFSDNYYESGLVLFNLKDFPSVHLRESGLSPADFAFKPGGHELAIVGTRRNGASTEVNILDVETNTFTRLAELQGYGHSLAWSPDGRYLALIGSDAPEWQPEAIVLRVSDGRIVYRTPVDPDIYSFPWNDPAGLQADAEWPSSDWPGHDWGVEFPVFERDLGYCAAAPQ